MRDFSTLHFRGNLIEGGSVTQPVIGVGAVIIDENDRLLLVQHVPEKKSFWSGKWMIPGGFLEFGEHLEEGVVREVLEETNLHVEILEPVPPLDRIIDENGSPTQHVVYIDYKVRPTGGSLQPGSDVGRAEWFDKERCQQDWKDIHPDTQKLLGLIGWIDQAVQGKF